MYRQYQKKRTEYKGPKEACILRSSKEGWILVSAPYLPDITPHMVEDIKSYIDSSSRKWNPDTKYWEVKESCLETLITILKKHFGADHVTQNLTTEETVPSNLFKPVFEALKQLPNGQMDKVFRALSMACHPDVGGSNELQKKLNDAYTEVKK